MALNDKFCFGFVLNQKKQKIVYFLYVWQIDLLKSTSFNL